MNLVAFTCIFVAVITLLQNHVGGNNMEERQVDLEKRVTGVQQMKDWRNWQWYLSNTVVSMNVNSSWQAGYSGRGILVAVVDNGVKINHPDLKPNFNLSASYDFLDDRNLTANYNPGSHGTKCAGIIAGGDNKRCGVGIAFGAQISSLRVFDNNRHSTDQSEAKALSFKRDLIDIYSNSWGPGDMGWQVAGPGPLLKETLEKGIQLGRRGKGSIFVFAAGNGGIAGDSCAFSGYVNSIYTIAISTVNWDGSVPVFAEECAGIMAVTYGEDMFNFGKMSPPPVITARGANDCTDTFSGTSASTAMASGILALVLQAKPDLTWRDIQHLIARSSQPLSPPILNNPWSRYWPSWGTNGAGLTVSSQFGFGLMDARRMIEYAKKWQSVPQQLSCEVKLNVSSLNSSRLIIPSRSDLRLTLSLSQDNCRIRYLEHMQAEVNLRFPRRGFLEMLSTSPSGTRSKLLYSRTIDSLTGFKNLTNWRVTSLHYWGEKPTGDWNFTIRNAKPWRNVGKGRVFGLKLIVYGTQEDPLTDNKHVNRATKKIEEVNLSLRVKEIPIHGGYSQWSHWSGCTKPCGGGIRQRSRSCTNPQPQNGGRDCSGLGRDMESRRCNMYRCPVHGGWSRWSSWSQCNVTCGAGSKQRSRTCNNPAPAYRGRNCIGNAVQSKTCRLSPCPPVHGGWSRWSSWSQCNVTCGAGSKQRSRTCNNPVPAYEGRNCIGNALQSKTCRLSPCPPACTNRESDSQCEEWFGGGHCSDFDVRQLCKKTCRSC